MPIRAEAAVSGPDYVVFCRVFVGGISTNTEVELCLLFSAFGNVNQTKVSQMEQRLNIFHTVL